jgi:hypothetical protein
MCRCVSIIPGIDAARGVDLVRALRRLEAGADPGDLVVDHEDVGVV